MRHSHLLIHLPTLFHGGDPEALLGEMPSLRALLSRGQPLPAPRGLSEALGQACELEPGPDWPMAAITARAAGLETGTAHWLRLDPVFLDVGMQGLMLRGGLDLTPVQADALADCVRTILACHGLRGMPVGEGALCVPLETPPRLATTPLDQVDGRPPTRFLPTGADTPLWSRIIHEAQMALHEHPVNLARQAAGQAPANSYWLWGGGPYPPPLHGPGALWSDDTAARRRAAGLGLATHDLPEDPAPVLKAPGDRALVLLDEQVWQRLGSPRLLDQRWFRPWLSSLRWRRLHSLSIMPIDGPWPARRLTWRDAWRPPGR